MKLTTKSLRIALISVLLGAFCEAGLAAQDFAGVAAVFQAIPAALRTPADGKWTLEQTSKVNAWLKEHVEGKTVEVPFDFSRARTSGGPFIAYGTCPRDMPRELAVINFQGVFPAAADVARLKKSKRGDAFTCTGIIKRATLAYRPRTNEAVFNIELDNSTLK